MKKYSFGLTASLKSALFILVIATFALATATLKQTKIIQAANTAISQTATTIKAAVAPVASGAMMQNPVCSALPAPAVQRGTDITSSVGSLNDFVIGDFNNDGKKDVAVEVWVGGTSGSSTQLHTYLGNGSGGFTLAGTFATNFSRLVPASAADFNGDGRQDVLMYGNNATGTGQQTINVITANANGVLGTTAQIFNYVNSDQYGRATLKTGDFNNDGRADFTLSITCCPDANYVYLSNPNGTHTRTTFNWGGSRVAIVGDINGDGNQDVVTSDNYYHAYTIRLGNGRGQFTTGQLLDYGVYLSFIGATDYNKDGRVDFVTYTGGNRAGLPDVNSNKIVVLTANSAGQITRFFSGIVPELNPPALTTPVATGDLTGDGNMDFVDGKTNAYLSNGGNGIYCAGRQLVSGVSNSEVLEAADFNGDGKADLLRLGQRFDTKIEVWLSGTSGPTNTPPTITAAASPGLVPGANYPNISIATVNDAETPRGNLVVTATAVPAGITLTNLTNANGTISALIDVGCNAAVGQNRIELTVTDGNGATAKANFVINVTASPLGQGIPDVVTLAEGMGVDFNLAISGTYEFSSSWQGSVRTDARSLLFRIQRAGPVGTHTLTFRDGRCSSLTRTITINVTGETPTCTFPRFTKKSDASIPGVRDIEKGDFNKDGKTDLAVFSRVNNLRSLTIRLGNGQGGFTTGSVVAASTSEDAALRVADYNGDGWSDIFLFYPQSIGVLINQGNGQFRDQTVVPLQTNTQLVADFNNDRKADFFSINYTTGRLIVHLGNGSGGFAAVESPYSPTDPRQNFLPLTGDFNGDGKLDVLLYSRYFESHDYYFGDGAGKLSGTKGTSFGLTNFGSIADYNKDGKDEAVFGVSLIDGVFFPNQSERLYFLGKTYPGFFGGGIAGDFNGDGRLDLATDTRAAIQDANGNICAAPNVFDTFSHELAADLDGDGKDDVVSPRYSSNSADIIDIYLTGGGITNTPPTITARPSVTSQGALAADVLIGAVTDQETPASGLTVRLAATPPLGISIPVVRLRANGELLVDFNISCSVSVGTYQIPLLVSDGVLTATTNWELTVNANQAPPARSYANVTVTEAELEVVPNASWSDDSGFGPQLTVATPTYAGTVTIDRNATPGRPYGIVKIVNNNVPGTYEVIVTALDRCGLTTTSRFSFTIPSTLVGCATPTFNAPQSYSANNRPYGLASGDFNGDGRIDLVTTNLWDHTITLLINNGNGFTRQTPIAVGILPNYIAARDLNGDNRLDLVVVNRGSDTVTILLGNGNGTFTKKGDYQVGNKSTGVMIGDFNGDGRLDLLLPNDGLGNVAVLNGNGDGSFQPLRFLFAGSSPQPGVVADFNRDGRADVALPNYFSGEVAILLGNAAGTFASPIYINNLGGPGVEAIALGDVNGDGNVDVAVTNTTTNQVFTIISDGRGGFTRGGGFATFSDYPASIVIADFTGDGKADIAVGGYNNNRVHIFKGLGNGFDNNTPLVLTVGNDPLSLLTNDFNGDGKPDLAIANQGSGTVSVLLNGCVR